MFHLLSSVSEGVPEQRDGHVAVHLRQQFQSRPGRQQFHLRRTAQSPGASRRALLLPLDGEFLIRKFFNCLRLRSAASADF